MATQETKTNQQQGERPEGRELSREPQSERGMMRPGISPFGFGISPADFFRNPFSVMRRMSEEMDRFFGESSGPGERGGMSWSPVIEVQECKGQYLVRAEVPGMKPEDVKVELTDDAIVLHGERKFERNEDQKGVHMSERRYGQFYRAVPLPEGVKPEEARAHYENGVLEITVPMEERRPKRREIPIEGGSKQNTKSTGSSSPGKSA